MNYIFLKIFTALCLLTQFNITIASECYHYHTQTINEIKVENGKAFWIKTIKDPNGISIASYSKTEINDIQTDNLHLVSENENGIIIANSEYYYWLDKNPYTFEKYGLGKIIESKKVTAKFGKNTFLINGRWIHIDYDPYTQKVDFTVIQNFPTDAIVLKHSESGRGNSYLLIDKNKVYSYDESEKTLTIIPNLIASKTQFYETSWAYDNHFLYDDNTFYLIGINFDDPQDITSEFISMDLKYPFTKAKIIEMDSDFFLDFGDNSIWTYFKDGIDLQGDENVHFYPIENAKYYSDCNMIFYNNQFYNSGWDLANNSFGYGIEITAVINREKLKEIYPDVFWDGEDLYELYHEPLKVINRVIEKSNEINYNNIEQMYNNAVSSYSNSLSSIYIDGKYVFNWITNPEGRRSVEIITPYKSIKDLKLAYLVDEKLHIENKWIDNIMDFATSEFIGSTVEIISDCDGGKGQYPVDVEYNYYFKDKNDVYLYHSGRKTMEKLNISHPHQYSEMTFIEKILKNKNYGS